MTDQHTAEASHGAEVIRGYLRTLPEKPGVYRMLDDAARVLYVGKARDLKRRVSNYAKPSGHAPRIARMISETASMMFLTTETETEALLLEQNLIKQLKPRYNVLLRDDKSFPEIVLTGDHAYPRIAKHRGARRRKGRYFGPFASAGAVNRTLNQLQKVFLLRSCSDAEFEGRTRPCLLYQIKRCSGPCVGHVSEAEYASLVEDASRFLGGRTSAVQEQLASQMREAAEAKEFERAAALRDRIRALTEIQSSQAINPGKTAEADVIALHTEGGAACVEVFFIRAHQNWGNHDFHPRTGAGADPGEVLHGFLGQFYADRVPPRLILLSDPVEDVELLQAALSEKAGRRVRIAVPRRGEKADLVTHARRNARESLGRRLAESAGQAKLLDALAQAFGLPGPPARIEVYDNSHIQGRHAVGGMIVAGPDGYQKSHYRKFTIREPEAAGDDFAMMREVLTRRFSRLLKADPDRTGEGWPDLLLIDGGAGQVSAVAGVMEELGVADIPMIGVAKGEDRDAGKEVFHRPGARPFALNRNDPVLYYVQRLRDEAHRFAIGAHRKARSKAQGETPLDEVAGVGAARKRKLLAHFGSAKAVGRAGMADLKAVEGISDSMAEAIYHHFHGGR